MLHHACIPLVGIGRDREIQSHKKLEWRGSWKGVGRKPLWGEGSIKFFDFVFKIVKVVTIKMVRIIVIMFFIILVIWFASAPSCAFGIMYIGNNVTSSVATPSHTFTHFKTFTWRRNQPFVHCQCVPTNFHQYQSVQLRGTQGKQKMEGGIVSKR